MVLILLAAIGLVFGVELHNFLKVLLWTLELKSAEMRFSCARNKHKQLSRNIGKPEHPEITVEDVEDALDAELAAKSALGDVWHRRPFWGARPRHFLLAQLFVKTE
jgi:hypothetical protein